MVRRFILPGFMVLGLALPAGAQSTQSSDPDASSVQIGPIGITPTILFHGIGRDENVFNEHNDPKSDFTFTLTPGATVLFKPRGMRVTYITSTDYVYYRKYKEERSTNNSSSVRVEFLLARFRPYVLVSGKNTKERLNQEVDARARHKERGYSGGLAITLGTRLSVGGEVTSTQLRFDPEAKPFRGESLARSFDSTVRSYGVNAGLQMTPFTLFTISVSREEQRFTGAPERDANSLRVTPTFSFSPQAVLSGGISFGFRRFTPLSPALPGYSGLVATVNAGTTLWNRNIVSMVFGRDLRYSYQSETPYYLSTGGTVTVTSQIAGPLDVQASGTRQLLAYRGHLAGADTKRPGDDTFTGYGGGLGWRIRERARFGVNIEWSRRDSQVASEREFRNRRIVGSLTWGKQL